MKRWIAFMLILACLLSLWACSKKNADDGPYVTVYLPAERVYENGTIVKFTYDENGNQISCIVTKDGKEISRDNYSYDPFGNQTEHTSYQNGLEISYNIYTYNEHNRLVSGTNFEKGQEKSRFTYSYDKDGHKTSYLYYTNGKLKDKYVYTYDQAGNLLEEAIYFNGEKVSYITYVHDPENKTVTEYHYGNPTLHNIVVKTHDDQNRVIRKTEYWPGDVNRLQDAVPRSMDIYVYEGNHQVENIRFFEGEQNSHLTRQYDAYGNIVSIIEIFYQDGQESGRQEEERTYTYDENGNIIQQKYYKNGECIDVFTGTTTYIAVRMPQWLAEKYGYI